MTTKKENKQVEKVETTPAQRFSDMVGKELMAQSGGGVAMSDFQKRLSMNYFIYADKAIQLAEENRLRKPEAKRDAIPVTWENVKLKDLAISVAAHAKVGLDPALSNHINFIAYKDNKTKKYDINLMKGYRGLELIAKKYALEEPKHTIIELVHENDDFKQIKKDINNDVEKYEFNIDDPFDRGEVKGGFYYHMYDDPTKNRLVVMSRAEIEKRKPEYASVEFWGGEKAIYENGNKTGKTKRVEGWFEKMAWKTVARAAYQDMVIDSKKVDDAYIQMLSSDEARFNLINQDEKLKIQEQNTINIDFEDVTDKPEPKPVEKSTSKTTEEPKKPDF